MRAEIKKAAHATPNETPNDRPSAESGVGLADALCEATASAVDDSLSTAYLFVLACESVLGAPLRPFFDPLSPQKTQITR